MKILVKVRAGLWLKKILCLFQFHLTLLVCMFKEKLFDTMGSPNCQSPNEHNSIEHNSKETRIRQEWKETILCIHIEYFVCNWDVYLCGIDAIFDFSVFFFLLAQFYSTQNTYKRHTWHSFGFDALNLNRNQLTCQKKKLCVKGSSLRFNLVFFYPK